MNSLLHIGNEAAASEAIGPQVVAVLAAIGEHRIDRETGIKALETLAVAWTISHVSITDCHFEGKVK